MKCRIVQTVLLLIASTGTAWAAGWRYVDTPPTAPLNTADFMIASDGALWSLGYDGVHRTDTAGATSPPLVAQPNSTVPEFDRGLPLADGGAMLVDDGLACSVTRVDRSLRRVWRATAAYPCADVAASPTGHVWLADHEQLYLYSETGRTLRQFPLGDPTYTRAVHIGVAPDGGTSVAATSTETGSGVLRRFDRTGYPEWSWPNMPLQAEQVFVDAAGSTYVVGLVRAPNFTIGNIHVYKLHANGGGRIWHYETRDRLEYFRSATLGPDGSLQVLMETDAASALYRVSADGALAWRKEVCAGIERSDIPTMTMLANGDTALVCADNAGARFLRIDRSGATLAEATLPTVNARPIATRADGTVQVRGRKPDAALESELYAVDVDGKVVDSPGASPSGERGQYLAAQHLATNGASYLLAHPTYTTDTEAMVMTKVIADGTRAWRRTVAGRWFDVRMTAAGGRLCIGGKVSGNPAGPTNQIRCYDDADGTERWSKTLPATNDGEDASKAWPPPGPPDIDDYQVLDDGSLIAVQGDATSHAFIRFDANGTQIARVVGAGGIASASLHGAGWATLSLRAAGGAPMLVRYDRQGNARTIGVSTNTLGAIELVDGSTAADGSVHAITRGATSPTPPARELWSIRADGTVAWKRAYDTAYIATAIVTSANAAYLVEHEYAPGRDAPEHLRVQAFARGDGVLLATIDDAFALPGGGGAFALSASGDVAVIAAARRERLRIARYHAVTGAPLDERFAACDEYCGRVEALALDANDNARVALNVADRRVGVTVGVFAQPGVGTSTPTIRIDQPGIAGNWWAPYANGEGFALDYLPDSRTFFMPWFTFAREGGNDARWQRWYVVQGAVAANATSAELPITLTDPGNFDTPMDRPARRVGTAFVSFTDCDNGTLRYAFDGDVNGGAQGTITLSRLGAAVADCVLADGTTRPGTDLAPPANGFDARLSGSWFEPATAGQGLQFVVQPGGVFFAPWFTFRETYTGWLPLPPEHRWFTVQGSLANARNGVVELPIVRTLGGAFDSVPTNNMFAVGTAKLTILGCDRATLDYRFDNTAEAADMRARAGTIDLVKAGGCVR